MSQDYYSKLTEEEVAALLAKERQPIELIQKISNHKQLEWIGKHLETDQLLSLLSQYPNHTLKEKVAPIFVGMQQDRFEELLDQEVDVLKLEGFSEPISHHLTLFIHKLEEESLFFFESLNSIEDSIQNLDPKIASVETVLTLRGRIDDSFEKLHKILEKVKKAMSIVWSTSNLELIEKLNKVNISLQRTDLPGELQALFSQKLFSIYNDLEADDPAIDGLANFSVWYLEDYVEVGLLPSKEQQSEDLFSLAKERLKKLHLCTVKDLMEAYIFSRETLKEYISQNKNLLA